MAIIAALISVDIYFLFAAGGSLLKGYLHIYAQIISPFGRIWVTLSTAAEAAAEKGLEYITKAAAEAAEAASAETAEAPCAAAEACARIIMTELIVTGTGISVGKHGISLIDLLEFFFRSLAVRIKIRVILFGQLFIGFFYVVWLLLTAK